jgi:hydrogenase-4 component H
MYLPKIREIGEAVKALLIGPYTSSFPKKPHVPHSNFRGMPKFNADYCVGCLACEQVCPAKCITHQDIIEETPEGKKIAKRVMIHYYDTCIICGQCEAHCIADHQGIKCSDEWNKAFFDRSKAYETIEKELELCEICGEPFACKDHLSWVAERVGELSYSSPTLYLSRYKELGLVQESLTWTTSKKKASDRYRILCARCRRQTTLEDL